MNNVFSALEDLNRNQLEAVTQHLDKPLVIFAGPGSGKTRTLTLRVAFLLNSGVDPSNILGITFTRKASDQMKRKLSEFVPRHLRPEEVSIGTFHHVALNILRANAGKARLPFNFSIVSGKAQKKLLESAIVSFMRKYSLNSILQADIEPLTEEQMTLLEGNESIDELSILNVNLPKGAFSFINGVLCKAKLNPSVFEEMNFEFKYLFSTYNEQLRKTNSIDLADILYLTVKTLQTNKQVLAKYQEKYKYILVDEFQDTNSIQIEFLKLIGECSKVTVCGDDDQAIYGWRGATSGVFNQFEAHFEDCQKLLLNQNYRSTQHIVNLSQQLISFNLQRTVKNVYTENAWGKKVKLVVASSAHEEIRKVVELLGYYKRKYHLEYRDIAILYRLHKIYPEVHFECTKNSIPIGKKTSAHSKLTQVKEVKAILCYLKLCVDTEDDFSLLEVVNYPKRGLGKTTIDKMKQESGLRETSLYQSCVKLSQKGNSSQKKGFKDFVDTVSYFKEQASKYPPAALVSLVAQRLKIERKIFSELEKLAKPYTSLESLKDFLDLLNSEQNLSANLVTLSTIHQAKGLEWKLVFVVRLNEDVLPSNRHGSDAEEERRLTYVACTRSKEILVLSAAQCDSKGEPLTPSRYLEELSTESTSTLKRKNQNIELPPKKLKTQV